MSRTSDQTDERQSQADRVMERADRQDPARQNREPEDPEPQNHTSDCPERGQWNPSDETPPVDQGRAEK